MRDDRDGTIVRSTSPIASRPIGLTFARSSRSEVKKAAAVEERRQDGDEHEVRRQLDVAGRPGTKPSASPPSTSRIGYGIRTSCEHAAISSKAAASRPARNRLSPS